jgi:hypothetical protein
VKGVRRTSPNALCEAWLLRWREKVDGLALLGVSSDVRNALTAALDEYERAGREECNQLLSMGEAADLSGYWTDRLRRLVRNGEIPNAGRPDSPLIRRGVLPLRPGSRLPSEGPAVHDSDTRRTVESALTTLKRSA